VLEFGEVIIRSRLGEPRFPPAVGGIRDRVLRETPNNVEGDYLPRQGPGGGGSIIARRGGTLGRPPSCSC